MIALPAMDLADAIVIAAYVAMALELVFLSVPSAVSTRQQLRQMPRAPLIARAATAAPVMVVLALFALPPLLALVPAARAHALPLPPLPEVRWIGVGLLVTGKLVTPLSLPPLRRALAGAHVARTGLFALSRHPGLVGLFAFYLGAALIYASGVLLAGLAFYVLHMHRRALMEEALLRARFPREYAKYAASVPRYLGLRR
jgi:protein-S-isoprenylcysteine O-methyltransferase Ste14